jgi:hypothetical protein
VVKADDEGMIEECNAEIRAPGAREWQEQIEGEQKRRGYVKPDSERSNQ